MKIIEVSQDELESAVKDFPEEFKLMLEKLIHKLGAIKNDSPVEFLKAFIERYDENCPIDEMIARTGARLILESGRAVGKEVNLRKSSKIDCMTNGDVCLIIANLMLEQAHDLMSLGKKINSMPTVN